MKGRYRWIALSVIAAAIVGGFLLLAPRWATHEEPHGAPAIPTAPDKSLTDLNAPANAETSEMLKMARAAFRACGAPAAPTELPDGKSATREQMASAHATVKAFDEATNIYNQCLDSTASQAALQFKDATSADIEALNALQVRLHNDAIDRDQSLANRFNAQLRLFKARGTT